MRKSDYIQAEFNEIGVSLPIAAMPEMSIPDNYFQQLTSNIQQEIANESMMDSYPKSMPYHIPENFFIKFDGQVLNEIHSEQLSLKVSRQTPYEIPAKYFEDLPVEIFTKINSANKPLRLHTFSQKWIAKLSLAATLLLFMGIAFQQLMPSVKNITSFAEQQLSTVSDAEINQYLLAHENEIENSMALESVDAMNIDLNSLETEIFDKSLDNISDEELLKYQF